LSDSKKKLLFDGHDFKFITDILRYYENRSDCIVKVNPCHWDGESLSGENERKQLLNWADVIIAEWCLGNAVWYSRHKLPHQKLFIRLHRHEITSTFPRKLNLNNVDKIIFIAPYIQNHVENMINLPKDKSILIFNAVDVDRFNRPKLSQSLFNIGMIGYCPKLKRLDKALAIFEELKKEDDRFRFYIKGAHPSEYQWLWGKETERKYYEELFNYIKHSQFKYSIVFEGWGNDVHEWLRNIGFLLSTSDIEGSHQAVAESMSSGSIPFITGWKGAELVYPTEFVKKDSAEIVQSILNFTRNKELYAAKQKEVLAYCYQHFDLDKVCSEWDQLLLK
jgi:glycosyltransferase involved in cell wall biosynthesis